MSQNQRPDYFQNWQNYFSQNYTNPQGGVAVGRTFGDGFRSLVGQPILGAEGGSATTNFSDFVGTTRPPFTTRPPLTTKPPLTPVDMNEEVLYTGKTRTEIAREAERAQLSSLADFRDLQRLSVVNQGGSMYQQAQMAMEQQRAFSDTRGLSAGAREGANQMLSATQQVALAQIQNATRDQLLQIDAQSLQDPKIAQDAMMRALEIDELLNPAVAEANSLFRNAEILESMGDRPGAVKALNEANIIQAGYYGYQAPEPLNPTESLLTWDAHTRAQLDGLNKPEMSDEAKNARNWAIGIGVALVVAGIALKITGVGAAPGLALSAKGAAMLAGLGKGAAATTAVVGNMTGVAAGVTGAAKVGIGATIGGGALNIAGGTLTSILGGGKIAFSGASLLGWQTYQGALQNDRNLSPEEKVVKSDLYIAGQIQRWRDEGFTEQEIEAELADFNATRLPFLQYQGLE